MAEKATRDPTFLTTDIGVAVISEVLRTAEPRPNRNDPVTDKNQYAVRFADLMANRIASDLFNAWRTSPRRQGVRHAH